MPYYSDLSEYLVYGYWYDTGERPHRHFSDGAITTITYDVSALSADARVLAETAMTTWEDVANLRFVQAPAASATLTFTEDEEGAFSTDRYVRSEILEAQVNVSAEWLDWYGTSLDGYAFETYVHEIGHALGLGHPGDYNGSADFADDAKFPYDSTKLTVMSYFLPSETETVTGSDASALTPQLADIEAARSIYGAAENVRGGDTTYGANSNLTGARWRFEDFQEEWRVTLVDTGGTDTIDASTASVDQVINLREGVFSSLHGIEDNLAIAPGTVIERAVGGQGDDDVLGNAADNRLTGRGGDDVLHGRYGEDKLFGGGGHDLLFGGVGNDKLKGGYGRDRFVFTEGDGRDRIRDFRDNVDEIALDADLWDGALTRKQVIRTFARDEADGDVVLAFGGETLVVAGLGDRWLLADDLVFI